MPQVFGCPSCESPFQVPDDAAGQTFQCPTCQTTIEVPATEVSAAPVPETPSSQPEIFQCPHCSGQFGIDASMYGENLSCPHCENVVAIGEVPEERVAAPPIVTGSGGSELAEDTGAAEPGETEATSSPEEAAIHHDGSGNTAQVEAFAPSVIENQSEESETVAEAEPEPEPVFEPQPVDHLLPPRFAIPDPVRFPARRGSSEVILPDGAGGYQAVDANIVTITHNGEVYHLKRLAPEQLRRRKLIHNCIAIGVAVLLIFLTLRTLGVFS